jgi:hypothetical protein
MLDRTTHSQAATAGQEPPGRVKFTPPPVDGRKRGRRLRDHGLGYGAIADTATAAALAAFQVHIGERAGRQVIDRKLAVRQGTIFRRRAEGVNVEDRIARCTAR